MTSEAYNAVKEGWIFVPHLAKKLRVSWILPNTWQKVKPRYSHRIGLARYPRQFKSTGIKILVGRALQIRELDQNLI
jgi:hypothetical protein